ncbi:hypothetical protein Acsp06_06120 [Actinomycetospora sp. NBRC 106375]|uniref:hypothetical protein n=1 Tax=Actinomycetospora sp. NBRC 106375 TaxID=3032207 RepID=UPI0024A50115|nr:hypothetical protein [Actinomycetospora sp. NBRC 106375]GLZ44427.1 hypothetical protein Acsp06_06120 [Actinomycetospora sp. NBRC 106375]
MSPEVGTTADRTVRRDLVVHLRRPEDLLTVDPAALLEPDGDDARIVPGAQELLDEVLARRRQSRRGDRVVLTLPAGTAEDLEAVTARLTTALRRWCRRGIEGDEREQDVMRRLGVASLRPGIPLFLVGLLFSTDFLAPDVPEFFQELLGNGVFLVIAWVGLWYPLDSLFFARLPVKRRSKALDALLAMPVEVRLREAAPTE